MKRLLSLAALLFVFGSCGEDDAPDVAVSNGSTEHAPLDRLDCGERRTGSERALRQFVSVLRRGDEREILALLARHGRFAWISAHDARGPDISVRNDRVGAAAAVAEHGGLPMTITRFMNSDPPQRTTDFGFSGSWDGTRYLTGKAAIDCVAGKALVISVGIPP